MLIKTLCEIVYNVFNAFLGWINIPSSNGLFDTVEDFICNIAGWGLPILKFIFPSFCFVVIQVIVAIELFERLYRFIRWILIKIPFLNIQ